MPAPKYQPKKNLDTREAARRDKAKIDQMSEIIKDKLKDSESLKKAAQILEEMLQDTPKKKSDKKKTGT